MSNITLKIVKTIDFLLPTFTQDCKHNKYYVIQYIITETINLSVKMVHITRQI